MADWGTKDMATALPEVATNPNPNPTRDASTQNTEKVNPQEYGWVKKVSYDYETYNKTNKEIHEANEAAGAVGSGDAVATHAPGIDGDDEPDYNPGGWASSARVYEWDGDIGDIGPEHPDLEKELFGAATRTHTGIDFSVIQEIGVTQEGIIRIEPIRRYEDAGAGLHPIMLNNVKLAGYTTPTPIQAYCLPAIKKGHDVVACAQTGSGKTAAYLIPTLSKLMGKAKKLAAPRPNPATYDPNVDGFVRAEPLMLIISPTRELATQIFDEARRFCYRSMLRPCAIYGGGPTSIQLEQLQKGCDILIATPGRLIDFIDKPSILSLHRLKYTIIDEADELLQEDWKEEFDKIMSGGNQNEGNINYMMFSATFPKAARALAAQHLANDHVRIRVGRAGSSHANIQQSVVWVEGNQKRQALYDLLMSKPPARTMIFVNSRRTADELDDYLFNLDLPTTSVHAERTQREREDAIRAFRKGKAPVMITTGVGARGWDVTNVMHVINYDLPTTQYGGIEEYTHRIGRTGRIGNKGIATSFYNERDEDIGEVLTLTLLETNQEIPDFLQQFVPEDRSAPLHFESDNEEETGADGTTGGGAAGGWGASTEATPVAAAARGASAETTAPAAAAGSWGAPTLQPTIANAQPATPGWEAPAQATIPVTAPLAASGWGGPPSQQPYGQSAAPNASTGPMNSAPPAATAGWGSSAAPQPPSVPSGGNWNAPGANGPNVGTHPAAPGGWNARPVATPSVTNAQTAAPGGWGAQPGTSNAAPVVASGWGAPTQIAAPTAAAPPATGGWNAPAPQLAAAGGWGAPTQAAAPAARTPAANNWGSGGGQGAGWSHGADAEW